MHEAFPSWGTMLVVDLAMVTVATACSVGVWLKRSEIVKAHALLGAVLMLLGLWVSVAQYIVDLAIMTVVPQFIGTERAVAAMRDLHLVYSWYINIGSAILLLTGIMITLWRLAAQLTAAERARAQEEQLRQAQMKDQELLRASEARFRDFAEASSDWFWEMDSDLRFTYFSERVRDVIGLTPKSHHGKTRAEFAANDIGSEEWRQHLATLERHEPFKDFEYQRYFPDVGWRSLSVSGVPVFDQAGTFQGYRGVSRDVTERWESDAALNESAKRYAEATRIAKLGHWVYDELEDKLTHCSEELARIHGMSRSEYETLVSSTDSDISRVHPDDREHYRTVITSAQREATGFDVEYRIVLKDGTIRHLREIGEPQLDESGRLIGSSGTVQDMTDQKMIEAELQHAKAKAEEASLAKSEFLAHMSHELRTPLNSILGYSEFLGMEPLGPLGNDSYRNYVAAINSAGGHLLQLIGDVLDLSKIEAGEMTLSEENVDIGGLLVDCRGIFVEQAKSRSIDLQPLIVRPLPRLRGDRMRLKQIVINLLSNAMKFTQQGGAVSIAAQVTDDGALEFTVSDTGKGIDPTALANIVEPFKQAHRDPKIAQEGTGLGLSLSKRLIELHDGALSIDSTVGKGTTVTVRFPGSRILPHSVARLEAAEDLFGT